MRALYHSGDTATATAFLDTDRGYQAHDTPVPPMPPMLTLVGLHLAVTNRSHVIIDKFQFSISRLQNALPFLPPLSHNYTGCLQLFPCPFHIRTFAHRIIFFINKVLILPDLFRMSRSQSCICCLHSPGPFRLMLRILVIFCPCVCLN